MEIMAEAAAVVNSKKQRLMLLLLLLLSIHGDTVCDAASQSAKQSVTAAASELIESTFVAFVIQGNERVRE